MISGENGIYILLPSLGFPFSKTGSFHHSSTWGWEGGHGRVVRSGKREQFSVGFKTFHIEPVNLGT